jgi:hypothetical protein
MSYKKLEIWQLAKERVINIHRMAIEVLPKFEMFGEGSQIRKSIKIAQLQKIGRGRPPKQEIGIQVR